MDIEKELNHNQYLAASSKSQYLRIIAGAGTGKTRTLTYRLAYQILQGINPKRMVAITFTNKAAKEMETRIDALLKKENFNGNSRPLISTFHGFCYRFLRKEISFIKDYGSNFQIADDENTNSVYKEIFKLMPKGSSKDFTQAVTSKISSLKTEGVFPNEVRKSDVPLDAIYTYDELMHVYVNYQKKLKLQNLLDFDDLLMLTCYIMENSTEIREYWQSKYDVFLIDEFQDTNTLQYYLVKLFMSNDASLTVVGDPDQTIYTWRGAKNKIIKDSLSHDYPTLETVILDENYRSTQSILDLANKLIANNKDRMDKKLIAANGIKGDNVEYNLAMSNDKEAEHIANTIYKLHRDGALYSDIAVIYRSNYLSNAIEKQLTNYRIPYEVYGGMKFFDRAEIKDAISYLRLAINPDDFSFKRILKAPTKGIGEQTLKNAEELRDSLGEEIPLLTIFKTHQAELGLNKKSTLALSRFYESYDCFVNALSISKDGSSIISAIQEYFNTTGFLAYVQEEDKKLQEKLSYSAASALSKIDNVNELLRTITQFFHTDILDEDGNSTNPTLEEFLINVTLQSSQDEMKDTPKVALMTGHVSKGLEFPYVFVTGLNQSIFPTTHALMDMRQGSIEEERRLLYVCMTRAKKKLYLSSFGGKNFRNDSEYMPSMFINELELNKKPSMVQNKTNKLQDPYQHYNAYRGNHRPLLRDNLTSSGNANSFLKGLSNINKSQSTVVDTYIVGDKVAHTSFGIGTVTKVESDGKIVVSFPEPYGERKLKPGFKAFRKLKENE